MPESHFALTPHCFPRSRSMLTPRTFLNVILYNYDKFFPVRPRVFMPEADGVTNLMHHNAELVTVLPDRNSLPSIPFTPNIRATSVETSGYALDKPMLSL